MQCGKVLKSKIIAWYLARKVLTSSLWNSERGSTTLFWSLRVRTSSVSLWCVFITSAWPDAIPDADSIRSGRKVPWPKITSSGCKLRSSIT